MTTKFIQTVNTLKKYTLIDLTLHIPVMQEIR